MFYALSVWTSTDKILHVRAYMKLDIVERIKIILLF